jgi:hypothetical protein
MEQQWIMTNPRREPPSKPMPSHPIFETWEKFIGAIGPGEGDYENFVEEAFRLHAAVTSFGPENIWLAEYKGEKTRHAKNIVTGNWKPVEALTRAGANTYGALLGNRHAGWSQNPIDDYCTLETFKKNAGRITGIGGFNDLDEETSSMSAVLNDIKESGANRALLKRRHAKLPLISVTLDNWNPENSIMSYLDPDEGWGLINDEGVRNAYLVQEVIPMRYEYRFFVINGAIVTGAGCVEELTPMDNDGEIFDSRMREYRNYDCSSPVESREDLLDRFILFAKKVVDELVVECPEITRYVLDVALGKNDEPVIVEFNGESNAGFYACQPERVTEALIIVE